MATAQGPPQERNQEATIYVGNLDQQCNEELLWELFLQAGPVQGVFIPKDRVSGMHTGYGFVEFKTELDADYAIKIMSMIKLFGKPIKVNKASQDKKSLDVGANVFVGNLDPDVDERTLFEVFSQFGTVISAPTLMRDETGKSKGFGFISFDGFESSDAAIAAMHKQYMSGKQISVTYAYKNGTKEQYGSEAERILAANNPNAPKSNFFPARMCFANIF